MKYEKRCKRVHGNGSTRVQATKEVQWYTRNPRGTKRDAHLTVKSHCHKSTASGVLMTDRSKLDQAVPPDGHSEPDGGSSGLRGAVDTSAMWMSYASEDTDAALLERLLLGDSIAFEELFLRHYGQVYRVLYSLLADRQQAEDLAQETFLALLHHPPAPDAGATLVAWLCRVALNRGYNALRSARRERARIERLAEPPAQFDPNAELLRAEDRARVQAALAQLPERQSQLLLLRHSGLAYAEIATALDVAPGSVGTLLARAERAFLTAYQAIETAEIRD